MGDQVIIVDIEGTIADIAFVKKTLFPYAREALPGFVRANAGNPLVAPHLAEAAQAASVDRDDVEAIIKALIGWIDEDRKITPLKTLQGMVWKAGYAAGDFTAHLYRDAYEALRNWYEAGIPLYVYSSGSVQAQLLYFTHTRHGDIQHWFKGFFDTTMGDKKEMVSYQRIAQAVQVEPGDMTFYSDSAAELAAAAAVGYRVVQLCREGMAADGRFPAMTSFADHATG